MHHSRSATTGKCRVACMTPRDSTRRRGRSNSQRGRDRVLACWVSLRDSRFEQFSLHAHAAVVWEKRLRVPLPSRLLRFDEHKMREEVKREGGRRDLEEQLGHILMRKQVWVSLTRTILARSRNSRASKNADEPLCLFMETREVTSA